ncbi:hypothetical protein [Pseudoalteromonas umbrosa]|uniref:hypothetical protein n=1 Tax=Pseudoalteromonas umbrosa TaxID=3048489 RepID=UPI0024C44BBB|nr:hypothetical protein [Pseudoalteromonas sp. B95]MDK1286267.1 hypothetical protein [Pseudoalteromonas sp. B95]
MFEIVRYKHGFLRKYHFGKPKKIRVSELNKIEYSYHAVVGFIGIWSFIDINGNNISASSKSFGIQSTLNRLEKALEGLSFDEFECQFYRGDVVDTLTVWESS